MKVIEDEERRQFDAVVRRYEPTITKLCYFYAENAAEVADMRQDTLLNMWRGWQTFRGDSERATWVHRVCLNTCVLCEARAQVSCGGLCP